MLIFCPVSVKENWVNEILKGVMNIKMNQIKILKTKEANKKIKLKKEKFIILSHEAILNIKIQNWLEAQLFKIIIVDESHKVKNEYALRT